MFSKILTKNNNNDFHLIISNINLGYTGGNNLGIQYCLTQNARYIFLLNNNNIDILYINDFIFSEYDNNYIFNYKDNITKLYYNIFKNIQIKTFTNCTNLSLFKLNIIDLSYNIIYDIKCDNCNKTTQCNKLFKNLGILVFNKTRQNYQIIIKNELSVHLLS